MHLGNPIPQAVEDHAAHDRLIGVQSIAGTAVIRIARAVLVEDIVHLIGEPAKTEGGPADVPLGGVVVDDVENHFDSRAMQGLDQIAELVDGSQRILPRTVASMRSEE